MSGGGDQITLLRSNSGSSEDDIEGQIQIHTATTTSSGKGITDLIKRLDRRFSSPRRHKRDQTKTHSRVSSTSSIDRGDGEDEILGDGAPPEWALLLLGCLLGLATGLCVAGFNRGVSVFVFFSFRVWIFRDCPFLAFVRVM